MSLLEEALELMKHNRKVVIDGGVNAIPSPFSRFRHDFPGVQRFYYVVTGGTKASKTQITQFLFVFNTIIYWLEHPEQLSKPKIFMFPLEEKKLNIAMRYYSYLYYRLKGERFSPSVMKSIDENHPIPQEVIDLMENDTTYQKYANAFEECVEFRGERHPTGMFHVLKDYMESHGKVLYKTEYKTYTDDFGVKHEDEPTTVLDKYIPDDPNHYVFSIVDHAGLISTENGANTLKDAIERHSMNNVRLRNDYGVVCVLVQQQNMETTNLAAITAKRIRPTKDGLKDSKRPGEDCSVLIGITNPKAFDFGDYIGYNITRLKDKFRVLEIVLNREGIANGLCPLFFDGAVNSYTEMPLPGDNTMENVYSYAETLPFG